MPLSSHLEKAIGKASQLPKEEQDALAEILMAEIEDEKRWDEAFVKSHSQLEKMGGEALKDFREAECFRTHI